MLLHQEDHSWLYSSCKGCPFRAFHCLMQHCVLLRTPLLSDRNTHSAGGRVVHVMLTQLAESLCGGQTAPIEEEDSNLEVWKTAL